MISVNTNQAMNLIALTETAFESLYYEYSGRMCNYAKHFLQDEYSAEELVQETFIRLWEKYQGKVSSTWPSLLFTMLRNGCVDRFRTLSSKKGLLVSESLANLCEERLYNLDFLCTSTTDDRTLYDELIRNINEKINSLPERCREVFLLSRQNDMTNKEIAEFLNISEKAVEKHITRALKKMNEITK